MTIKIQLGRFKIQNCIQTKKQKKKKHEITPTN